MPRPNWTHAIKGVLLGMSFLGFMWAGEREHRIPSGRPGLQLYLREAAPRGAHPAAVPVLILHGATFPSSNAAAWRMQGRSWMDALSEAGFNAWALDFLGYGGSSHFPELDASGAPLGGVEDMVGQVDRAVAYICAQTKSDRVLLIAHSAGTFVAGRYAETRPDRVARLVLFGAPAPTGHTEEAGPLPGAYLHLSIQTQWEAFEGRVKEARRLDPEMFQAWGTAYLASDPGSGSRTPPSVRVPAGMAAAYADMVRTGKLPYAPEQVRCPTLLILGEWDEVSPLEQSQWIFRRLPTAQKRLVMVGQGGHRLHLEASREQLYLEVGTFLSCKDSWAPPPAHPRARRSKP